MEIKDQLIREFAKRVDDLKKNFLQMAKTMIEEEEKKKGEYVDDKVDEELVEDKKKRSRSPLNKKLKKFRKIQEDDDESEDEYEWVAEEKIEKNIDLDMKIEDGKEAGEGKDMRKGDGVEKKVEEKLGKNKQGTEKSVKKEEGNAQGQDSGLGFSKKLSRPSQSYGKNERPEDFSVKLSSKDQEKTQSENTSKKPENKEPVEQQKTLEEHKETSRIDAKKDHEAKISQKKLEPDTKSLTKKPDSFIPQKSSGTIENTSKSLKEALDELSYAPSDRVIEILNTFTNFLEDSVDKALENFVSLSAGKFLKKLRDSERASDLKDKYQAILKLLQKKANEKASEKKIDKWESLGKSLIDAQTQKNDSEILALINKILDYLLEKINPADIKNIGKVTGILENICKDTKNSKIRNRGGLALSKFKEKIPKTQNLDSTIKPHIADRLKGIISNIN
ncbi:hypothetical protein SteCoe_1367 [Stentor coeruleus]|uniref:Uncharacterized protein n=1 Tax=Stentor coeruleus TaxID=5963 RepID=A0A1R2D234_9CILI|nr:hypothetical protein SteCoe_1367 [Stentor coeruleus]